MNNAKEIQTILAFESEIARFGLRKIISNKPELKLMYEIKSSSNILKYASEIQKADLIIIDFFMLQYSYTENIKILNEINPKLKMLLFLSYPNYALVENCLNAGVKGIISNKSSIREISDAIRNIVNNGTYLCKYVKDLLLKEAI